MTRWLLAICIVLVASSAFADIAIRAVTIRDGTGNSVGAIDSDGVVRTSSSNSVGKIEKSGTIRDGAGNSVGAVLFFFQSIRSLKK